MITLFILTAIFVFIIYKVDKRARDNNSRRKERMEYFNTLAGEDSSTPQKLSRH